jgi:uncharacterized protein (TIGR02996 family)
MSTETDLLRAVRDNPDEDTPRLMYADYLDEEGNAARAEFIRVQIEHAHLPEGDPWRRALEDRAHELLAEHECEWLGIEPDDMGELAGCVFERGFVNEVSASPVFMNGPGAALSAAHPIRRWRVTSGVNNMPEDMKEASQRGWVARLETLAFNDWWSELNRIGSSLGRNSNFERLRELDLTHLGPLDPLAEIIEYAPFRDQLKSLRCGMGGYEGGRLDPQEFITALGKNCALETLGVPGAMLMTDDVRDLLQAEVLASLTALDLHGNPIEAAGWDAFRGARFKLRELDLSQTQVGGGALDRLLGCAALAELRRLNLNSCGSSAANIRALAASRFWAQAEVLRMQNGTGGGENYDLEEDMVPAELETASLNPLFTSKGPSNLRVLDIAGNNVRDFGVALLCDAAWAGSLTELDLSQNYLTDEALRDIARSGRFKNLRALRLNNNSVYQQSGAGANESITDAGLRLLADCADLVNLRELSLSGTRITAAGIEAILNSPHFRLTHLKLANCQLRSNVIDVFTASARTARLELLDLGNNDDISDGSVSALAESEYLSPQTVLNVIGTGAGQDARDALSQRLGRRLVRDPVRRPDEF